MRGSLFVLGALSFVSVASMVVACSGSSSDGGGASSGGLADGGPTGEGGPDGATTSDAGDAGACPAAPSVVVEANAGSLDVSGDEVVFMDHNAGVDFLAGVDKTKAVRKVKLDGTSDTVLYTSPAKHQINDVKTVGTTVYFLESERDDFGNEATSLFSMPVAGGTPVLIGKHADPNVIGDFDRLDAIITADADNVFVARGGPSGETLWRFAVAGGAETLVYRGAIGSKPAKVADQFYFKSFDVPSGVTNYNTIVKVPAAGGGAATAVGATKCSGDVVAGAFGILCVGSSETMNQQKLSLWDTSGANHQVVFALSFSGGVVRIGPTDTSSVYAMNAERVSSGTGTGAKLWKAPLTPGTATVVACDRQEIPRRKTVAGSGSNGTYVAELDMVATATELVWTETRKEGMDTKVRIFRTAR
jgi:hypothetical protein